MKTVKLNCAAIVTFADSSVAHLRQGEVDLKVTFGKDEVCGFVAGKTYEASFAEVEEIAAPVEAAKMEVVTDPSV